MRSKEAKWVGRAGQSGNELMVNSLKGFDEGGGGEVIDRAGEQGRQKQMGKYEWRGGGYEAAGERNW